VYCHVDRARFGSLRGPSFRNSRSTVSSDIGVFRGSCSGGCCFGGGLLRMGGYPSDVVRDTAAIETTDFAADRRSYRGSSDEGWRKR
jgi:hypothetical protein